MIFDRHLQTNFHSPRLDRKEIKEWLNPSRAKLVAEEADYLLQHADKNEVADTSKSILSNLTARRQC